MAYCTKCGTLMADEDMYSHFCNAEDIPQKGKPIRKGIKPTDISQT